MDVSSILIRGRRVALLGRPLRPGESPANLPLDWYEIIDTFSACGTLMISLGHGHAWDDDVRIDTTTGELASFPGHAVIVDLDGEIRALSQLLAA